MSENTYITVNHSLSDTKGFYTSRCLGIFPTAVVEISDLFTFLTLPPAGLKSSHVTPDVELQRCLYETIVLDSFAKNVTSALTLCSNQVSSNSLVCHVIFCRVTL